MIRVHATASGIRPRGSAARSAPARRELQEPLRLQPGRSAETRDGLLLAAFLGEQLRDGDVPVLGLLGRQFLGPRDGFSATPRFTRRPPPVESGQYASVRCTERSTEAGTWASVGSVADAYDNSMAEALNDPKSSGGR